MKTDVDRRRLAAAVAIAVGLVAAVPLSGYVIEGVTASPEQAMADGGIRAEDLVEAADVNATLGRIEQLADAGQGQLPGWFEEEIGLLRGARNVRVDGTGHVVGLLVDGALHDALEDVRESMMRAGWSAVSLGEAEGATFVKEGGTCTWALVTCTQVGSSTAVVYRCVVR